MANHCAWYRDRYGTQAKYRLSGTFDFAETENFLTRYLTTCPDNRSYDYTTYNFIAKRRPCVVRARPRRISPLTARRERHSDAVTWPDCVGHCDSFVALLFVTVGNNWSRRSPWSYAPPRRFPIQRNRACNEFPLDQAKSDDNRVSLVARARRSFSLRGRFVCVRSTSISAWLSSGPYIGAPLLGRWLTASAAVSASASSSFSRWSRCLKSLRIVGRTVSIIFFFFVCLSRQAIRAFAS